METETETLSLELSFVSSYKDTSPIRTGFMLTPSLSLRNPISKYILELRFQPAHSAGTQKFNSYQDAYN